MVSVSRPQRTSGCIRPLYPVEFVKPPYVNGRLRTAAIDPPPKLAGWE